MRGVEQIPWVYDAMCSVMEWTGLSRWREWLVKGAQGRTLEVGCGTGRNLARYPPSLCVIALEPDALALKKAKSRAPNALLVRGSAEALPFRDGAFDTVVSSLVFCSVPQPEVGLREIGRVLTADGQLRMLEHVRHDSKPIGWVQDLIQPAWTGRYSVRDWLDIYGGPLFAFSSAKLTDVFNTRLGGGVAINSLGGRPGNFLGTELDLGISARYRPFPELELSGTFEAGIFFPGNAFITPNGENLPPVSMARFRLRASL
jgi:SAM-dependent methyltransferase